MLLRFVLSLLLQLFILILFIIRSPLVILRTHFWFQALHSHPDIVSAGSVSSEPFVPLCHSFALSTSLVRKASSSLANGRSRSNFPLIEWSLASSSPRGI